jgi:hypothetical protein
LEQRIYILKNILEYLFRARKDAEKYPEIEIIQKYPWSRNIPNSIKKHRSTRLRTSRYPKKNTIKKSKPTQKIFFP